MLGRLMDAHGRALVLYARQWCRSPDDVVQEAFVELIRQADVPEQPLAWLYRVVRNRAISAARSAGRRTRRETAVAGCEEPWFTADDSPPLDPEMAVRLLEELPIDQRETIVARLWGGLGFEQIAELTGTSVSTAHRRYHAGLAALRERLNSPCAKNLNT
jgi:RNA polymerase sigma-70 factor (ECF subfamily)